MSSAMFRSVSKKALFVFLATFYLTALLLGTICSFDPSSRQTHHHHQQGRTVSHTASCLLACSSTIADHPQALSLTLALLLIGILSTLGRQPLTRRALLRLHGRSPPLFF